MMTAPEIKISVIILNWNTKEFLQACLESIYKYIKVDNYEIIVVDNASSDQSVAMIEANFPEVIIISNRKNTGFAKGNNLGAEKARGRYLLFLNSDTLFIQETDLKYLILKMEQDNQLGICACQLLNRDGSLQKSVRNFPYPLGVFFQYTGVSALFNQSRFFNQYLNLNWEHDREEYVEQPSGAFLLIPAELFFQVGGFEEAFFIYYEDVDLCRKVILKGKKILFSPQSKLVHYGGESAKQVYGGNFFERNKNLILYYRKYHSSRGVLSLKLALFTSIILRSLGWFFKGIMARNYFYLFKEAVCFLSKMWSI